MQKQLKAAGEVVGVSFFTRNAIKRRLISAGLVGSTYLVGMASVLEAWGDFLEPGILLPFAGGMIFAALTTPKKAV